METFIMAAQLIAGISLLVLIHEAGHFFAARMFGIKVEKFYLFFDAWGIKLLRFKRGDTEYGIGWLPLGGYCKIAGMIDESMDKESIARPPQEWEYRSKPAWQRLIVIAAGVILNLITGILIFALLIKFQEKEYVPTQSINTYGIYASSLGEKIGFRTGDKILRINGKEVKRFKDTQKASLLFGSSFEVERDGKTIEIILADTTYKALMKEKTAIFYPTNHPCIIEEVLPGSPAEVAGLQKGDHIHRIFNETNISFGRLREYAQAKSNEQLSLSLIRNSDTLGVSVVCDSSSFIGITCLSPYDIKEYTFLNAFYYGNKDAWDLLSTNAKGLGKIFTGQEKASESVQGPIGIAKIYGSTWNWYSFWYITAMISLILAFMNILPIPALDGGHIMFTLYEIISRRKPNEKFMEYAQMVGMFLLFALMFFAIGNDIINLFR